MYREFEDQGERGKTIHQNRGVGKFRGREVPHVTGMFGNWILVLLGTDF